MKKNISILAAILLIVSANTFGEPQGVLKNQFGLDLEGTLSYRRAINDWIAIGPRFNPGYFYTYQNEDEQKHLFLSQEPKVFDLISIKTTKRIMYIINDIEINLFKRLQTKLSQEHSFPRDPPIYLNPRILGWNLVELKIGYLFEVKIEENISLKPGIEIARGYADISQPSFYGDLVPKFNIEILISI